MARLTSEQRSKPEWRTVRQSIELKAAPVRKPPLSSEDDEAGNWFNFGSAEQLDVPANSPWSFRAGFWPVEGLRASNTVTGEKFSFSFETPFAAWNVRNVVQLSSDQVIFQLGIDQICIFEPSTRRVALLWRGRGAVPVIAAN